MGWKAPLSGGAPDKGAFQPIETQGRTPNFDTSNTARINPEPSWSLAFWTRECGRLQKHAIKHRAQTHRSTRA
eukprot:10684900-Alexandrium_andersonii.AAC.1